MNMLFVGQIKFMDIISVKNLDKYELDLFFIYFYPNYATILYVFYFVSTARDGVVDQGVYHLLMPVSAAR